MAVLQRLWMVENTSPMLSASFSNMFCLLQCAIDLWSGMLQKITLNDAPVAPLIILHQTSHVSVVSGICHTQQIYLHVLVHDLGEAVWEMRWVSSTR